MPAVQPPCKVLVSGASGFVAMWVVQHLLTRGYLVKTTVRSVDKGEYLKKTFAQYGDKLKVVIVEDMVKVGDFVISRTWHHIVWWICVGRSIRQCCQGC